MLKIIKLFNKYCILFLTYGFIYFIIESIYKLKITSPYMFLVGGIVGVLIGLVNNLFDMSTDFLLQCGVGTLLVLLMECIVGYDLNIIKGMAIWDYSRVPMNFVGGQICIPFAVAWFILSGICIVLDDYLRYWWFSEEKPYYIIWNKSFEKE